MPKRMTPTLNLAPVVHILLASLLLAGCSVGMAMSGKPDPNISALAVGQSRDIVVLNLGQPTKTLLADNKRTDVFELERGNQQSIGRATGHAVMDLLTLGGWELIGTPIEGVAGDTITLQIEYDEENTVKSVKTVDSNQAFYLIEITGEKHKQRHRLAGIMSS